MRHPTAADSAQEHGILLFLDTVCTLGGVPLRLDEAQVDITYSGSQKCLGAPPGAAPFSMGPRAREKLVRAVGTLRR